jgi:hypothetical protein
MVRTVLVFVHLISVMGVFGALAIEGAVLLQVRRSADLAQLRTAVNEFRLVPRVAIPSVLATILSGLSLAAAVWGWRAAWIGVGLLGLIVTAVIGAAATGPRMARLQKTLDIDDRRDPLLLASFIMRTFILVGIVFLMTVKPPLQASLIAMATAAGAGCLACLPRLGRRTSQGSMVSA